MFLEERFPEDISYGAIGGPQFSTTIVTLGSGYEQRNINWAQARGKWSVSHSVKTETQMQNLVAFFNSVLGMGIGFRFKDWTDYFTSSENIGVGDGTALSFQLKKNYLFGAGTISYNRAITKPVAGTEVIYANGVIDATATVDSTNGLVTFLVAPAVGAIITADFEFDVPVRFDMDDMRVSLDHTLISSWSGISIIELK